MYNIYNREFIEIVNSFLNTPNYDVHIYFVIHNSMYKYPSVYIFFYTVSYIL